MTSRFANPPLTCDIVMKGGITSGVVYPGAVVPLAERYRFCSIGGASAGGIAAAIVAAAELSSDREGFEKVASLREHLAGSADGPPLMLSLFKPDRATRPLFQAVLGLLREGALRKVAGVIGALPRPLAAAGAAGLGIGMVADPWAGIAVVPWLYAAGLAAEARHAARVLADNDFGICRLGPEAGSGALTEWLHTRIQDTAGRPPDAVVTFADLWLGPTFLQDVDENDRQTEILARSRAPEKRAIDLQMMTTDLTHGRPLRLPVPYHQYEAKLEEGNGLLFEPEELRRYFLPEVVDHLEQVSVPLEDDEAAYLRGAGREALKRFPIGPDLPVVVATRMTLSFPLLISAVPLWELEWMHRKPVGLHRVLFSDGGITSNFPIHFFDSPLPRRPTFGLDLTGFPPNEQPNAEDPCADVAGPVPVQEQALSHPREIKSLKHFGIAIKDAMQNWRDNAQAALPGFRERIVHIKLGEGEGGLNLTMDRTKTLALNDRGKCAGERLVEAFSGSLPDPEPTKHWNDSRFARYRTTMAQLERFLRAYAAGYDAPTDAATERWQDRIIDGLTRTPYKFRSEDDLAGAQVRTTSYRALGEDRGAPPLDDDGVPRPPSTLRGVPPV